MYCYRVTKYNPIHRNEQGVYVLDEWTAISDVSTEYDGQLFELDEYLRVEELYVSAIKVMMDCVNINYLMVSNLNKYQEFPSGVKNPEIYTHQMKTLYGGIFDKQMISNEVLSDLCKLNLREQLGFRLIFEDKMYVHFGYDYYMYIGVNKECKDAINSIQASGLFVEEYESPYYQDDED